MKYRIINGFPFISHSHASTHGCGSWWQRAFAIRYTRIAAAVLCYPCRTASDFPFKPNRLLTNGRTDKIDQNKYTLEKLWEKSGLTSLSSSSTTTKNKQIFRRTLWDGWRGSAIDDNITKRKNDTHKHANDDMIWLMIGNYVRIWIENVQWASVYVNVILWIYLFNLELSTTNWHRRIAPKL